MDNQYYRSECDRIQRMAAPELDHYIADLERDMADPYPDDDLAGDIAVSRWHSLAVQRREQLKEQG